MAELVESGYGRILRAGEDKPIISRNPGWSHALRRIVRRNPKITTKNQVNRKHASHQGIETAIRSNVTKRHSPISAESSSQVIRNMYFSAKLLFETRPLAHGDSAVSIEERIVLLDVPDECAAAAEATLIGKREEFTYEASDGGMVTVRFLGVRNVYRLIDDTIGHGTEIHSESHFESND